MLDSTHIFLRTAQVDFCLIHKLYIQSFFSLLVRVWWLCSVKLQYWFDTILSLQYFISSDYCEIGKHITFYKITFFVTYKTLKTTFQLSQFRKVLVFFTKYSIYVGMVIFSSLSDLAIACWWKVCERDFSLFNVKLKIV